MLWIGFSLLPQPLPCPSALGAPVSPERQPQPSSFRSHNFFPFLFPIFIWEKIPTSIYMGKDTHFIRSNRPRTGKSERKWPALPLGGLTEKPAAVRLQKSQKCCFTAGLPECANAAPHSHGRPLKSLCVFPDSLAACQKSFSHADLGKDSHTFYRIGWVIIEYHICIRLTTYVFNILKKFLYTCGVKGDFICWMQ